MHAREYDWRIGRFTAPDPARDGWNPYAYVSGNPVNFVDPEGLRQVVGEGWNDLPRNVAMAGTTETAWGNMWVRVSFDPTPGLDPRPEYRKVAEPYEKNLASGIGVALGTGPLWLGDAKWSSTLETACQYTAGLADSLLFGFGDDMRRLAGNGGLVARGSRAYHLGELTSLAIGFARLGYAVAARGLAWRATLVGGDLEAARAASAGRNLLKRVARLGLFPNYRIWDWASVMGKYKGDADAIIAASGRTDPFFNRLGFGVVVSSTINQEDH